MAKREAIERIIKAEFPNISARDLAELVQDWLDSDAAEGIDDGEEGE